MPKKYKVELTEKQMQVIEIALEEYMRLRLSQDNDFVNELASMNHDLSPSNPHHNAIFDHYIQRRDHLHEVMQSFFRIAFEPDGYLKEKTETMNICECLWDAIRFAAGRSRWSKPFQIGTEPSPRIEVIENDDKDT